MKRFWTLVKKDWRLYRVVVVGLLLSGTMPYLIGVAALFWQRHEYEELRRTHSTWGGGFSDLPTLASYMEPAAGVAMFVTGLLAAVFGAVAFAQERRDRSAEFLAMVPARRSKIIYSKLVVSAACLLGAIAIHVCIAVLCVRDPRQWRPSVMHDMSSFLIVGVGLFGLSWFFSTFLSSPAIAASIAIGLTCFVAGCVAVGFQLPAYQRGYLVAIIVLVLGLTGILVGSVYYKNRVAP